MKHQVILATLLLAFALPTFAQKEMSHEQAVKKGQVPKVILAAFEKAYPKAKVKGYSKETDAGKVVYEIESKEGTVARDVSYDSEGNLLSVEETLPFSNLPKAVQDASKKEFPKSKIAKCEKVVKGTTTQYELVFRSGKNVHEVVFDPDGKVMEKEEGKEEKE